MHIMSCQINSLVLSNPLSIVDIKISIKCSKTISGHQFVLKHIKPVENRILDFLTNDIFE